MRRNTIVGNVTAILCIGLASCGGPRRLPETGAEITGTIKLGDKIATRAIVSVEGPEGYAQTVYLNDTGQYFVNNIPLGTMYIGVMTGITLPDGDGVPQPKPVPIPRKYAKPRESGLIKEIDRGVNTYDIVLVK